MAQANLATDRWNSLIISSSHHLRLTILGVIRGKKHQHHILSGSLVWSPIGTRPTDLGSPKRDLTLFERHDAEARRPARPDPEA